MLQNAYLPAKIGVDTAENERNFAENLRKFGNYPTSPRADAMRVPFATIPFCDPGTPAKRCTSGEARKEAVGSQANSIRLVFAEARRSID